MIIINDIIESIKTKRIRITDHADEEANMVRILKAIPFTVFGRIIEKQEQQF